MKNGLAVFAWCSLGWLAIGAPADDKPGKIEPGFTALFNGKDLAGWHVMNNGKFSAKAGVIFLDRGAGWLRSDKQYKDFELRLDVRFLDKGADSGIFIRASLEGKNWPDKNYQVQTMDNYTLANSSPRGLDKPKVKKDDAKLKQVFKPASGEWVAYAITAKGPHVEVRINGELITVAKG